MIFVADSEARLGSPGPPGVSGLGGAVRKTSRGGAAPEVLHRDFFPETWLWNLHEIGFVQHPETK